MTVSFLFTVGGSRVNKDPLLQATGVSFTQDDVRGATDYFVSGAAPVVFRFNDKTQSQYLPLVVGNFL